MASGRCRRRSLGIDLPLQPGDLGLAPASRRSRRASAPRTSGELGAGGYQLRPQAVALAPQGHDGRHQTVDLLPGGAQLLLRRARWPRPPAARPSRRRSSARAAFSSSTLCDPGPSCAMGRARRSPVTIAAASASDPSVRTLGRPRHLAVSPSSGRWRRSRSVSRPQGEVDPDHQTDRRELPAGASASPRGQRRGGSGARARSRGGRTSRNISPAGQLHEMDMGTRTAESRRSRPARMW